MDFEEEHLDLLQNIEFAIIAEYRADQSVLDVDVRDAIEALARHYQAQELQRTPSNNRLAARGAKIFGSVRNICEARLGRSSDFPLTTPDGSPAQLNTLDEVIAALKRIRKSVDFWNKQGGRQGYLTFVRQYV